MIEYEIYYYVNGFLKWNISNKTNYIIGNKFFWKISILNLRNKRKSIFARIIIRYYGWKKITKEMGKIIIKSTYRWSNVTKFRKCVSRGKLVHFRSTKDMSKSRTRRIQFIIYIFVTKGFFNFNLRKKRSDFLRYGLHWVFGI